MKDYYTILGVPANESPEGIKQAFKQKAKLYHPDVCKLPDAHQRFIDVAEAYEILRDPDARAEYDRLHGTQGTGKTHYSSGFERHQQRAQEAAMHYSSISLENVLAGVAILAAELGRGILLGSRDKPKVTFKDYARMGSLGILLLIAIGLCFTGIGTAPGVIMGYYSWKGATKDSKFLGLVPFLLSTVGAILALFAFAAVVDMLLFRL